MENGIDLNKHEFFAKDVFLGLPKMGIIRRQFQAVLLDPPTLARVRRRDGKEYTRRHVISEIIVGIRSTLSGCVIEI